MAVTPITPTELKMRQFLRDQFRLESSLVETAVRIQQWTTIVLADGFDDVVCRTCDNKTAPAALDVIEKIAEELVADEANPIHQLLSKSLQETLLYCMGVDPDLSYSQMKGRLMGFLKRRGGSEVVRRFLMLGLFNVVWFRTGESFRAIAATPASFERDMVAVEHLCRRIAESCWRSQNLAKGPLDSQAVEELIRNIEKRLRNGQAGDEV